MLGIEVEQNISQDEISKALEANNWISEDLIKGAWNTSILKKHSNDIVNILNT